MTIKVRLLNDDGMTEEFGDHDTVEKAVPALLHAVSHAKANWEKDGKVQEVSFLFLPVSTQAGHVERHVICQNESCRCSGANIMVYTEDVDTPVRGICRMACCKVCGLIWEISEEDYNLHQDQMAAAEQAASHVH